MNQKEFVAMIERFKKQPEHFRVEKVELDKNGDRVFFDFTNHGETRYLKINRFPETFSDGTPIHPSMAGKISITQKLGENKWKNITREVMKSEENFFL
jgi:hypothetical protein